MAYNRGRLSDTAFRSKERDMGNGMAALAIASFMAIAPATPSPAQQPDAALQPFGPARLTAQDYDHAARLLSASQHKLVRNVNISPNWLGDGDRFWYRKETADGAIFQLVDARKLASAPAFDHARLAEALSRAAGQQVSSRALPFRSFDYGPDGQTISFNALGASWRCSLVEPSCAKTALSSFASNQAVAPGGSKAAFRRDRNLWIKAVDGRERALTTDGVKFNEYGYVSGNSQLYVRIEDLPNGIPPSVSWSPDATKLLTHRIDETRVGETSLWQGAPLDGSRRPKVTFFKQSHPEDANPPVTSYMIFDVASGKRVDVTGLPPGMIVDPIGGLGNGGPWLATWTADSKAVYILARDRYYKQVGLFRVDAATGEARLVVRETGTTFVSLNGSATGGLQVTVKIFDQDRQLLWYSERDGWGHLYRYDLATGKLLNQLTSGPWVVSDIVDVDERSGVVYFLGAGREKARNPYQNSLYRVNLNGSGLKLLTPENADHAVSAPGGPARTSGAPPLPGSKISPSYRYFVDSYSRVDTVPMSVLRSAETGKVLMRIEEADFSALADEGGWTRPVPFVVKARDGKTDIFGTMYLPSRFDPTKRYPVIDNVYPAAHFIYPDIQAFSPFYFFRQALADLGFIVVNMDGLGTPGRGKAFHNLSYGNLQDGPGLPDHVEGIRELAQSHPQIDLDRVGVVGHSSGGYGAALAMLKFPEFYKVGVASAPAANMCGLVPTVMEKWQGAQGSRGDNCDPIVLAKMASNLRGKLLLAYGDMDEHAPAAPIIQFIDALAHANRDFDLIVMPNKDHGFWNDPYFQRRMFDYFVRNLMGSQPPQDHSFAASPAIR